MVLLYLLYKKVVDVLIIIFYLPGDRLQQGEDLAAAVNVAASEQNYEAE